MCEKKKPDEKTVAQISAEATIAWLKTPEGAKHLRESMERAEKFCEEMREKSKVDWKVLYEPMTL